MNPAVLLSPSDVLVIRRYVQTKYAPLPQARQAEIVADAVRGTIERRLPELEPDVKARITQELIRRCLISEGREVIPEDVLNVCEEIAIQEPKDLENLSNWLEEIDSGRWSREQIATRLNRVRTPRAHSDATEIVLSDSAALAVAPQAQMELMPVVEADLIMDMNALNPTEARTIRRGWVRHAIWGTLSAALAIGVTLWSLADQQSKTAPSANPSSLQQSLATESLNSASGGMPAELRFMEFNSEPVLAYLHSRNSLLAEEPYFTAIVASAKEYDVNPLFLLAITGQEQGFVPKTHKEAKRIANNPFNVFHSWQEYNTDIRDSSRIAAKTIAKRGKTIPAGEEPIAWINETYAEDLAWSKGVRQLFDKMTELSKSQ